MLVLILVKGKISCECTLKKEKTCIFKRDAGTHSVHLWLCHFFNFLLDNSVLCGLLRGGCSRGIFWSVLLNIRCNFTYIFTCLEWVKSLEEKPSWIQESIIFVHQTFKVSQRESFSVQSASFKNCENKSFVTINFI